MRFLTRRTGTAIVVLSLLAAGANVLAPRGLALAPAPTDDRGEMVYVAAPQDAFVALIGRDIRKGEHVSPNQVVMRKVGDEWKKYRCLAEGDPVEAGQVVVWLDDRQAEKKAADAAALKKAQEILERRRTLDYLRQCGVLWSDAKYQEGIRILRDFEEVEKAENAMNARRLAERELFPKIEVQCPSRGIIRAIYHRPGEAVKAGQPILRLEPVEER